jgi:pseudaminic acid biosynthesis-associated methylase
MKSECSYKTDQEMFWAGDFGSEYIKRNQGDRLLASNLNFFVKSLASARGIGSCIEFGANIGMNIRALQLLYPGIVAQGVEINAEAALQLAEVIPAELVHHDSILDVELGSPVDLALIKGVLIHLNPNVLPAVYDKLVSVAGRYLLVAEYYNPSPVAIPYRGHADRLFKRDFAGEIMQRHPQMKLVDYGFAYRGDPDFPQDDITWFLMERR